MKHEMMRNDENIYHTLNFCKNQSNFDEDHYLGLQPQNVLKTATRVVL